MEDFERMKEIFEYHQAKNSGKQGADLYPEGYGTSEKRSLRRYANKYQMERDKLGKTWTGPYEITDIVGRKHVYLDDKKTKRNISHLKPWIFPEEQLQHGSCNTDNAPVNSHAKSSPGMNKEEPSMASEFSEDKKESINLFVENPSHEDALSSSSGEDCHPCTSSWSRLVEKARDDYHVEENSNGSDAEKQQSNEAESKCSTTTSKLLKTTRLSVPAIPEDIRVNNEEVVYRTDTSSFIAKSICIDVSSEAEDAVSEPKEKLSNTTYSAKQVIDGIWSGYSAGYIESRIGHISLSDKRILELKENAHLSDEVS
eukprot:gene17902-biopygen12890